ncbi:hypothetical protein AB837_00228 [bacterium AB1]|nr:hypothetical protein AB837_00228 [bacterium AB1]
MFSLVVKNPFNYIITINNSFTKLVKKVFYYILNALAIINLCSLIYLKKYNIKFTLISLSMLSIKMMLYAQPVTTYHKNKKITSVLIIALYCTYILQSSFNIQLLNKITLAIFIIINFNKSAQHIMATNLIVFIATNMLQSHLYIMLITMPYIFLYIYKNMRNNQNYTNNSNYTILVATCLLITFSMYISQIYLTTKNLIIFFIVQQLIKNLALIYNIHEIKNKIKFLPIIIINIFIFYLFNVKFAIIYNISIFIQFMAKIKYIKNKKYNYLFIINSLCIICGSIFSKLYNINNLIITQTIFLFVYSLVYIKNKKVNFKYIAS